MTEALPNLQQITIGYLGDRHKYSDGEDPEEGWAARTADWPTYDIEIISNFSKLRILNIQQSVLNGRYPVLFNFPLLEKLRLNYCCNLKWDLEMLAGLPLLKELDCKQNKRMAGNINSLRVLKDTLEKVKIVISGVEGNFMDLADFPRLKELDLDDTAVTGDIRDIGESDFSSLEQLDLPKGVYGGRGYELQRISDGPDVVRAVYLLRKQRPALSMQYLLEYWYGELSEDSSDWYDSVDAYDIPPFYIYFAKAGSRVGYRWQSRSRIGYRWETNYDGGNPCEVNWLDPEPDRESDDYAEYTFELQEINSNVSLYRGFHQPPTEEEYHRLFEHNG